jgi:hypothetical protein
MKKLLRISTLALVMLSLITVSCEKADVAPAPVDHVKVTWTPENSSAPITTTGDIKDGEVLKDFTLEPKLVNPPCKNGTWHILKVEKPDKQDFACVYANKYTGKHIFRFFSKGTYKIIFIYKCPDGSSVSISISITVS